MLQGKCNWNWNGSYIDRCCQKNELPVEVAKKDVVRESNRKKSKEKIKQSCIKESIYKSKEAKKDYSNFNEQREEERLISRRRSALSAAADKLADKTRQNTRAVTTLQSNSEALSHCIPIRPHFVVTRQNPCKSVAHFFAKLLSHCNSRSAQFLVIRTDFKAHMQEVAQYTSSKVIVSVHWNTRYYTHSCASGNFRFRFHFRFQVAETTAELFVLWQCNPIHGGNMATMCWHSHATHAGVYCY